MKEKHEQTDSEPESKSIPEIIIQRDREAAKAMLIRIADIEKDDADEQKMANDALFISGLAVFEYPSNALVELARIAGQIETSDHLSSTEIMNFCNLEGSGEFLVKCGIHIAFCHNCGIRHEELAERARLEMESKINNLLGTINETIQDLKKKSNYPKA